MRQAAVLMGILIYFGFASVGALAQEKPNPTRSELFPPEAMVPSEEFRMGGVIIAVDPARNKVLIQQYKVKEERIVALNLDEEAAGKISTFRKGDAVNIWVKGDTVTKIEKIPESVWEEIRKE